MGVRVCLSVGETERKGGSKRRARERMIINW